MSTPLELLTTVVAPKFAGYDGGRLSATINVASGRVGTVFGANRNLAIAYLAAHMLEISNPVNGSGGMVTSEKEGQLARSYGVGQTGKADPLDRTVFGQQFKQLRSEHSFGPRTAVSTTVIPTGDF